MIDFLLTLEVNAIRQNIDGIGGKAAGFVLVFVANQGERKPNQLAVIFSGVGKREVCLRLASHHDVFSCSLAFAKDFYRNAITLCEIMGTYSANNK